MLKAPRGSHVPAVADDDAELEDNVLLDGENVELDKRLLEGDEVIELPVEELDEVVVNAELTVVDVTDDEIALEELEELNDEVLAKLMGGMPDVDSVVKPENVLDVLIPDEAVRLLDTEDEKVLVEGDELRELEELRLFVMIELAEDGVDVLDDPI
jgi:hypothetical protein